MGISEVDGSIVSFTLTLVDKGNVEFTGYPDIITPPIEGCSRFKTDGLFNENGYFNDKNDIKVGVSSDSLRIFFEKLPIVTCVRNGRIMFGLAERKSLAMIEVSKMNKAEYERLLLAFNWYIDDYTYTEEFMKIITIDGVEFVSNDAVHNILRNKLVKERAFEAHILGK
ncbi:hypothetical protein C8Z91_15945 [Paenibacillus elgii]|uniref:Uncharacterized protein n=1 Tax=Paenibacillus elgii TaxID=189691 RepID=A0A2T6G275_9BACL|nr:hypothetical protein [Paenibacillus elgii]PUA38208.1 hypothetical protein C8Z91_15945 [Paenibacillus elgii]